jgi:solute carrier family 50 (sugar transporter)
MSLFVQLCGVFAPAASIIVGLSPASTIHQIRRDRNVGSFPLLPYSTMIVNATLWFVYGLLKQNPNIWFGNGICLILGIIYFVLFIQTSPPSSPTLPGTVQQHIQGVLGICAITIFISIFPILDDPAQLIGSVGCFIVVVLFASPLVVLRQVLVTKDAKSIPLPFTIACTINCFLWSVYGVWGVDDVYIYFPNVLGLALSVAQLLLKIYYSNGSNSGFSKVVQLTEGRSLTIV